MKIITWGPSADAPPSQAWIARFLDGKRFLPTFVSAPTLVAVHTKAQAFLDAERERLGAREGRKPATVADAIIERVGKADPVYDADDRNPEEEWDGSYADVGLGPDGLIPGDKGAQPAGDEVPDLLLDCPDLVTEPDDIDDLLSPDG